MKLRLFVPIVVLPVVLLVVSLGLAGGLGLTAINPGSRVPTLLGGAGDLDTIEAQIGDLEAEVSRLESEVELLQTDPFAIERAIREDLRMAKRTETVIHLSGSLRSNHRFH